MRKIVVLYILLLIVPFSVMAQPKNPGSKASNTNDNKNVDQQVPVAGIEILVALGGLFGASRFFKGKNKSKAL